MNIIIVTSCDCLQNLWDIFNISNLTQVLTQKLILVSSERIAKLAEKLGFEKNNILKAPNATTSALIETLLKKRVDFSLFQSKVIFLFLKFHENRILSSGKKQKTKLARQKI